MAERVGLAAIPTRELERLLEEVRRGSLTPPLSKPALAAAQLGRLWDRLSRYAPLDAAGLTAVLETALSERAAAAAPYVELVWTGPEGRNAWSRPTAQVVRELFERARSSVLLAGYSFDHGQEILEPLHAAMRDRNVAVDMYLHIGRAPRKETDLQRHAENELVSFLARNWPFGPPHPVLHYDPRTLHHRSVESLHAKCIVIDERLTLIGSANFTDRGQSRNIEVGAEIEDASFARALINQWKSATAAGVFVEWKGDFVAEE